MSYTARPPEKKCKPPAASEEVVVDHQDRWSGGEEGRGGVYDGLPSTSNREIKKQAVLLLCARGESVEKREYVVKCIQNVKLCGVR